MNCTDPSAYMDSSCWDTLKVADYLISWYGNLLQRGVSYFKPREFRALHGFETDLLVPFSPRSKKY